MSKFTALIGVFTSCITGISAIGWQWSQFAIPTAIAGALVSIGLFLYAAAERMTEGKE